MTAAIRGASLTTAVSNNALSAARTCVSLLEGAVLNRRKLLLQDNRQLVGACFLIGNALVDCRAGDQKGEGSIEEHFELCRFSKPGPQKN